MVTVMFILLIVAFAGGSKKVSLGSEVHFTQDDFKAGIKVNGTEIIDSSGQFTGAVASTGAISGTTGTFSSTLGATGLVTGAVGFTATTGDLVLTDGRVDGAIEGSALNCDTNAVTIPLATSAASVVVADQVSGACAITLSGGSAGEFVILDLVYGGDTAWTFAAGGHYGGDTFDESACNDFQATAADGDHLIVAGYMVDADTIAPISCQYLDQ